MDDVDEYGNFLRKSVNDITSMLDINFGSLDRPRRGGRGRGNPVGPGGRPERAKPTQDKVRHRSGAGSDLYSQLWRLCSSTRRSIRLQILTTKRNSQPYQLEDDGNLFFHGNVGCTLYLTQVKVFAVLKVWGFIVFHLFSSTKRHC